MIVADLEAGIGTLTRLAAQSVDITLVVVEPTPRSIDVARRAVAVADERQQGRVVIVANKVTDQADRGRIEEAFANQASVIVSADQAIDEADRRGVSPLDFDPESAAVKDLQSLTELVASATG